VESGFRPEAPHGPSKDTPIRPFTMIKPTPGYRVEWLQRRADVPRTRHYRVRRDRQGMNRTAGPISSASDCSATRDGVEVGNFVPGMWMGRPQG
jgi:hypothetical protein